MDTSEGDESFEIRGVRMTDVENGIFSSLYWFDFLQFDRKIKV